MICPSCEAFISEENPAFCPRCGVKFASEVFDDTQSSAQLPSQPQADSTRPAQTTASSQSTTESAFLPSGHEDKTDSAEEQTHQLTLDPDEKLVKIREYIQRPSDSEININGRKFTGTITLTNKNLIFVPLFIPNELFLYSEGLHQIIPLKSISGVETGEETLLLRIGESEQASFAISNRKELETWAQEIRRARESANQRNESLKEEEVDFPLPAPPDHKDAQKGVSLWIPAVITTVLLLLFFLVPVVPMSGSTYGNGVSANVSPSYYLFHCGLVGGFSSSVVGSPSESYSSPLWLFLCG